MSNSLVTYVSSENNREKRSQINNVIQSLHCYINNSTPDKTEQEYGVLSYTGCIKKGQVIQGSKHSSKKFGTPVIANGAYLGDIDQNGRLIINNIVGGTSNISTNIRYIDINYCLVQDNSIANCTSCYWKDVMCLDSVTTTCCECEDQDGKYIEVTTCCTWKQPIHERCVFSNAYRGSTAYETIPQEMLAQACSSSSCSWHDITNEDAEIGTLQWLGGTYYPDGRGYYPLTSVANAYKICQASADDPVCIYYGSCYNFRECVTFCNSETFPYYIGPLWNPHSYCSCVEIGPFLCGYCDGKMVFDKLPGYDTSSVTYNDSVSRFERGSNDCMIFNYDCCLDLKVYGGWRTTRSNCGCMDKVSSYCPNNNGKVMICQNSVYCCTLIIVSKQRPLKCVSINERYI